jgi:protein required for attachment to host cells
MLYFTGDRMDTTWIVSADAGRARIYAESNPDKPLQEVEDMVNGAARLRDSEINTDGNSPHAAGKSSNNTGGALPGSDYQPAQTPAQHNAEIFSKDIATFLMQAQREGKFQKLALVASPKFLGLLRVALDPQLKNLVSFEIDKDYTHSTGQQLQEQIKAHNAQ